ncbi:MAG: DNA polymerase III subunit delta' [Fuerstiella sp.]
MLNRWEQLKGHDEQRQLFARSLARGRLSHAYVFAGPSGTGKLEFARLLAMSVFCRNHPLEELRVCGECRACRGFAVNSWPDFHEVGLLSGKREILIGQMAGEGDKRGREGLCYELSMTPQASDRRVAVINDAHRMTTEAANAMLKTLEEPPADALLILVTDSPESLLPTILSRCQLVRFFPLTTADVRSILLSEALVESEETAKTVSEICEGSLETAQQLLDSDLRMLHGTVTRELALLDAMNPLATAKAVMETIEQISGNAAEQRQNAQWLLKFVGDALRIRLKTLVSGDLSDRLTQRLGARRGIDLLTRLLDRTVTASLQLDSMVPVNLAVSALFDELAGILRASLKGT